MNGRLATMASRYAGRPLLLTPRAAQDLAARIHEIDARAFERPGRLQALMRRLAGSARPAPMAMEDDHDYVPVPFGEKAAYAPLYIGEPDDLGFCWSLKDGVALMQADTALSDRGEEFCGVVYHGYDTLLAGMREASADDRVKALFIRMACPGGVVAGGLNELATFMRANRASAGGKPIHVYADMACSAAYWIAAQADHIVAPRVGLVGSIGAVIVHEDWSVGLEKMGVKITAIQFGEKKTEGAWWEALGPAAAASLQSEIDQCGRDFVADVAAGRAKLTPEALLATEAGVFMANHDDKALSGLELGFVDEISGEEAAFSALAALVSSPQSTGITPVAAPGGRAAAKSKDKPMAVRPETIAAQAAARTALAAATANLRQADADVAAERSEDDPPPEEAPAAEVEEDAAAETEGEASEASGIAASAEGKAHPAMALAAIQSGQTLAQFKASVAAGGARAPGALREAMANAPRLGADAPAKAAAPRSAAQIYADNAGKGAAKK